MDQTKEEMQDSQQSKNERISRIIRRTNIPFMISQNSFNQYSQIQVSKVFGDLQQHDSQRVPLLKQNCLLEFIKNLYPNNLGNQNKFKNFQYFCQCTNNAQSYSLVIYGIDTPISICCKQLICFQFCMGESALKILCLDPICQFNPLEQKQINSQFLDTIFSTPNEIVHDVRDKSNQQSQLYDSSYYEQSNNEIIGKRRKSVFENFSKNHNNTLDSTIQHFNNESAININNISQDSFRDAQQIELTQQDNFSFCWAAGCINMSLSLVFQAVAHHSKKLDAVGKDSMLRAVSVHQISSLGFILLSMKGAPLQLTCLLSAATFLFPYVIYYQAILNNGQRVMLTSMVPKGGVMHMMFWISMGLFYFNNPKQNFRFGNNFYAPSMTDSSNFSDSNIDQSNESEKYIDCKSDCSHCNKEEIKQNSDLLALQTELQAMKNQHWQPNLNVFERSQYEINQNDSQFDLLKDKIRIINERSLDLDDIDIDQLSSSRKRRKPNEDSEFRLVDNKAIIDMGRVLASVDKQLQREKEESKRQSYTTSPVDQLQNLSFGKDQQQNNISKDKNNPLEFSSKSRQTVLNFSKDKNYLQRLAESSSKYKQSKQHSQQFKQNQNCEVHGVLLGSGCKYCNEEKLMNQKQEYQNQEEDMDKITQSLKRVTIYDLSPKTNQGNDCSKVYHSNQEFELNIKNQNDNHLNFDSFDLKQQESKKRKYEEITNSNQNNFNNEQEQQNISNFLNSNKKNSIQDFNNVFLDNLNAQKQFQPYKADVNMNHGNNNSSTNNNYLDSQRQRFMDTQSTPSMSITHDYLDRQQNQLTIKLDDIKNTVSEAKLVSIISQLYDEIQPDQLSKMENIVVQQKQEDQDQINKVYLNFILKQLLKDYKNEDQDSDLVILSRNHRYWLSKKSLHYLYHCQRLNDEIINSFTRLISSPRQFHSSQQKLFHFFDSFFFLKLSYQIDTNTYNFIDFASYFDKSHFQSPKIVAQQSVMIFVVNNEEDDFVLIVVDIYTQQFIVYDPIQGRQKETFLLHVKKIKRFLTDYFQCFPPKKLEELQQSQIEQQQDIEDLMSFKSASMNSHQQDELLIELQLDRVDQWLFTSGSCFKINDQYFQQHGSGIFIVWYLDQLSQCLMPQRSQNFQNEEIQDLYSRLSVELLTSQLLSYI